MSPNAPLDDDSNVLPNNVDSTQPHPSVLTQGMTEKEREIFSKLLVDLFLAYPRKRAYQQNKGKNQQTDEKFHEQQH